MLMRSSSELHRGIRETECRLENSIFRSWGFPYPSMNIRSHEGLTSDGFTKVYYFRAHLAMFNK